MFVPKACLYGMSVDSDTAPATTATFTTTKSMPLTNA